MDRAKPYASIHRQPSLDSVAGDQHQAPSQASSTLGYLDTRAHCNFMQASLAQVWGHKTKGESTC